MKVNLWIFVVLTSLFLWSIPSEARVGGGRSSSGSRGYRGFQRTPSTPRAPYRREAAPNPSNPFQQGGGSSFFRGMLGGLAGGFLGSMLFRGFAHGAPLGYGGGGGIGFFDILLLVALVGGAIWFFRRRNQAASAQASLWGQARDVTPEVDEGTDVEQEILKNDPNFDFDRFRDHRTQDFFKVQAAYSSRDIGSVKGLLGPEITETIEQDIRGHQSAKTINRLENIAVRDVELVDAWNELGQQYATVRFSANLLDYTVDETTGNVVKGDKTQPTHFEEDWTFVRPLGSDAWKLTAIQN